MNFATWSIANRIPVVVLFIFLSAAGVWGFRKLPVQNMPDLDLPTLNITLSLPGAAPAQLESDVARKAEDALATIQGIKHQTSQIVDGQVRIKVRLNIGQDLSYSLEEAKDAIDHIRSDLPANLDPPVITAQTRDSDPILTYAVGSTRLSAEQLSWFVDDAISKAALAVSGVASFERIGGVTREIRIDVDPVKLSAMNMTAVELSHAIGSMQVDASGGRSRWGGGEQSMRVFGKVGQPGDLDQFPMALPDGRFITMDQVAPVHDGIEEQTQAAKLGEKTVVGFRIYRAKGADEIQIAARLEEALQSLQLADPTISLTLVSSTVDYTRQQYAGSMDMLYEGALLAILVVGLFLRDVRATFLAAVALPLSIAPTFAVMHWLGYSLNTLTLLALAVIIGVLVDDVIVEIENIERHRRKGKPILQATTDAVVEIALPVTATTLALVAVFLPTAQMAGVPGLFFQQFGWTAVVAILMSLVVARLLTPMMAVALLSKTSNHDYGPSRWVNTYHVTVCWCLEHKKTTLLLTFAFLLASVALIPLLPTGFVPSSDRGFVTVDIELAPGASLDASLAVGRNAREALKDIEGIKQIFTVAGINPTASFDSAQTVGTRFGTMTLMLVPRDERTSQSAVETMVRERLALVPGARFSLGSGDLGKKFEMILTSDNSTALGESTQNIQREMRGIRGLFNVTSSATVQQPEIEIRPNMALSAERGVSTAVIGETVRIATSGDFDSRLPRLDLDSRQIFIRVRLANRVLNEVSSVSELRVRGHEGLIPLGSVAEISMGSGPAQISRFDRKRFVSISADISGTALGSVEQAVYQLQSVRSLPSDVLLVKEGDSETMEELASGFLIAMITGTVCVYLLLAVLFKDFFQPMTILSVMPLCFGGAFAMLLITGSELNVPSMVGLVMLLGIVTKNSILLVDCTLTNIRRNEMSIYEALLDACTTRVRAVVMTSMAMIAGMLPIALGFGADASFRQPMAFAVIGGLLTSTALSLLVVPVVFTYVEKGQRAFFGLLARTTSAV